MRNISIIGTGYVGLTTGICLAYLGHNVVCVDSDRNKIQKLKEGVIPIYEPGLAEILKNNSERIDFTTNLGKAVKESEVIFICVGTPSRKNGSINLRYFKTAIVAVSKSINDYKVIVNKSTVPVGAGEWTRRAVKKNCAHDFSVVSNPEFLKEGTALKDFLEPDRIIIGVEDDKAREIMLDIYFLIKVPQIITDIKSAELIKYAANAFLATKISFINEIANICEKTGGDIKKVARGIGTDKRIGDSFLNAGIGYGGSCFPKDVDGLIHISNRKKYDFKLLKAVAQVNKNQQELFSEKIVKTLRKIKGRTVCVWGLSFKPGTDDVRKSPAIEVIRRLQKEGFIIRGYDPVATQNAQKELSKKNIEYFQNPIEAAKGSDALVLVTDWPEFLKVDMGKVKKTMRHPYIFDGRNQFNPEAIEDAGFYYCGVGRG